MVRRNTFRIQCSELLCELDVGEKKLQKLDLVSNEMLGFPAVCGEEFWTALVFFQR